MTFQTIFQAVSKNAGIQVRNSVQGSDPDIVKITEFINEAGREIARRVDWGALRKSYTCTGTGASAEHPMPDDFARLCRGLTAMHGSTPVRGSLSADEWSSLTSAEGDPRYFYLRGGSVSLYPYLATGDTAKVFYQSKNWMTKNGSGTSGDAMSQDDDAALIPETLIVAGAVWRWRRHVGKEFADYLTEFETMLLDMAGFDSGTRAP